MRPRTGDGTNRAVAKGSGKTPLLPISTGTNNVIPSAIEGTIAGLAAGIFARGLMPDPAPIRRTKRLEIACANEIFESALVDIAISTEVFLGARAITDLTTLRQLWLTQAVPGCLGLLLPLVNIAWYLVVSSNDLMAFNFYR